ncbi:hypothetical protein PMG11_09132 [Penicillium brasilianum]|uniref:Beta-glucuronidase C-terminal domain-containing protein n=1 Tax=Penicillium brasilianum TaxID=104259 RepID=A0A0F7TXB0_PENBI|nr:hypothetical protein PMG11_09132 [Penicillium brasilianum]
MGITFAKPVPSMCMGCTDVVIPIPASTSAVAVPADFFGFGFESGLLHHYDNTFSNNMVHSIQSRMSKPLVIRVGGTSGDHITFEKEQTKVASDCHSKNDICTSLNNYTVGPGYFDTLKLFQGSHWTLQAPMGDDMKIEDTMAFLQQAWDAATNKGANKERVAAIALGNEPNWYKKYDVDGYIQRSQTIEERVVKDFKLKGDETRIFQTGEIAAEVAGKAESPSKFTLLKLITPLFKAKSTQQKEIKYAAEHYYQVIGGNNKDHEYGTEDLKTTLMNHKAITDKLAPYAQDVKSLSAIDKSVPLVISEAGSAIGHTKVEFAGGFGAAIWAVDFHLAAMSRGIQRVCNTHGPNATHAWWLPDDTSEHAKTPAVQGIFPAAPFITDFIGKGNLGKIKEIDLQNDFLSAYAMFDQKTGKLSRIAVINLRQWESGPAVRPRYVAQIAVDKDVKSAVVQRMQSEYGAAAIGFDLGGPEQNVTWNGEQWSWKADKGIGHKVAGYEEEHLIITKDENKNGKISVNVWDTEAVIVNLS